MKAMQKQQKAFASFAGLEDLEDGFSDDDRAEEVSEDGTGKPSVHQVNEKGLLCSRRVILVPTLIPFGVGIASA